MRKLPVFLICFLSFLGVLKAQDSPVGAWKSVSGEVTSILLITPSWFTITDYKEKSFIATYGGTWKQADEGGAAATIIFNTANPSQAGQKINVPAGMENGHLVTGSPNGGTQEWTRVDDGTGALSGNWKITARDQDGKLSPIHQSGPRQTIKILSGTRFQWIAINLESGEFFGSGGGAYTFENGIYTEKIEFFSRDNSRVGAVLTFNGKVTGNDWDHSGKSSKGDPIHEVWSREQP